MTMCNSGLVDHSLGEGFAYTILSLSDVHVDPGEKLNLGVVRSNMIHSNGTDNRQKTTNATRKPRKKSAVRKQDDL